MERAVALTESDIVFFEDLPPTIRGDHAAVIVPSLERCETMRAWGRRYARLVVERCHGNKRQASRFLGISYHTLVAYLKDPLEVMAAEDTAGIAEEGEEATVATAAMCPETVEV